MKSCLSIFLLGVITLSSSFAQSSSKTRIATHKNIVNALLQPQHQREISRSPETISSERVIGQHTRDNTLSTLSDSVKTVYGLNGTSTYDFNMMDYAYNYVYNTSPVFNYAGLFTAPQILYKTYIHRTVNPNTLIYGFYEKNLASYDANNNLIHDTATFADSAFYPNMVYSNKYTSANIIDTGYAYKWSMGVASNAFKQFYTYNVSNKVTKDSMYEFHAGTWHLVSKTFYTYDGSGNLILIDNYGNTTDTTYTMPLVEQSKYTNTYDGTGRLLTVAGSYYNGASLQPSVKDTFAYTGATTFHTSWKEYQYDPINLYWAPWSYMTKTLNVAGFPSIVTINGFDSLANAWVPSNRYYITYNTFNDPTKLDEYIYNFTSFPPSPNFTTWYYYESFVNTTGVNAVAKENENFVVYPNPSCGTIAVSWKGEKDQQGVFTIYDLTGRKISSYTWNTSTPFYVNLMDLDNGIYFYQVIVNGKVVGSNKMVLAK